MGTAMKADDEAVTVLVSRLASELNVLREQYADVITARSPELLVELETMSDTLEQFISQPR